MPRPYFAAQNSYEHAKSTDNLRACLLRPPLFCGLNMQTDMYRTFTYRVPRWQYK